MKSLLLFVLLLLASPALPANSAQALEQPEKIWTVDFRFGRHAFDWARRYPWPLDEYEPVVLPHSWSADGQQLLCEGWYTGGSPIDTIDGLYLLNLPARASYRLYTTGGRGVNDPGIVWSWNPAHDRLYYQTRGGADTGFWSWNLDASRYRHAEGPPQLTPGFRLRELDGLRSVSHFASDDHSYGLKWIWNNAAIVSEPAFDSMVPDQRNRISEAQKASSAGRFSRGNDELVSLRQPGTGKVWERRFSDDYVVFQLPAAPHDLIVLYREQKQLWFERHRYGISEPVLRKNLPDPAPETSLELSWAPRHGKLLVLLDSLYLLDPGSLTLSRFSSVIGGSSRVLLLNPQESALVVATQHWQEDSRNGTVMHLFRW